LQIFLLGRLREDLCELCQRVVFVIGELPPVRAQLRNLSDLTFLDALNERCKLFLNLQQIAEFDISVHRNQLWRCFIHEIFRRVGQLSIVDADALHIALRLLADLATLHIVLGPAHLFLILVIAAERTSPIVDFKSVQFVKLHVSLF
jgi:hypothetical protein